MEYENFKEKFKENCKISYHENEKHSIFML